MHCWAKLVRTWAFAPSPTIGPSSVKATTDGMQRRPCSSATTSTIPSGCSFELPWYSATTEYVVPRSMPSTNGCGTGEQLTASGD